MIGIIGAMQEEVDEILKLMDLKTTNEYQGYTFYEGIMNQKEIILLRGGIGKVNAAISTTLMMTHYNIDFVINIGSAGGLQKYQNVGDIVISNAVAHHDVDVTAFGHEMGKVPGLPLYFEPDNELLDKVKLILERKALSSHIGLIVSGDQFISQKEQVSNICKYFPQAMCSEMEAATIAQVCYTFGKKFIITRSLSDVFEKGNSSIQFDEYLKKASQSSAHMCYELVSII
ncbi:MAG: 5'-methylthioadenosine/adenosylhomocysteine nucleosidase [Coprobacillus sp.]|nr:5'-methylthioadenosine/adenosylhomocysteine nucleosidase [Coprobacillus sp.]